MPFAARPHAHRGDPVALAILLVERDRADVVLDDRGARRRTRSPSPARPSARGRASRSPGRTARARTSRARRRGTPARTAPRASSCALASASRSRSASVNAASRSAARMPRRWPPSMTGTATSATPARPPLVVGKLPGLGRGAQQRLAIAQHRAEHAGIRQPRGLGDVVGIGGDLLELDPLAVVVDPQQRDRARAERALERREHPARRVADHADAADREQALLLVAGARRAARRPERGGDQPVVAARTRAARSAPRRAERRGGGGTARSARAAAARARRRRRSGTIAWRPAANTVRSAIPVRTSSAASRSSAAPSVATAPGRASTVIANATRP